MKEQQIRKNIADRLGIDRLNDMQVTMTDVNDPLSMLIAPTGSGKTLAFTIAALRYMQPVGTGLQTVIIAPSRELVLQIYEVVRPVAVGYKTVAMYGGHNMQDETNSLAMMPDIIVATPGRLVDHIKRGNLRPGIRLHCLVLDEYDKALELGFSDEMRRIIRFFVAPEHIILTSATVMDALPEYLPATSSRVLDFSGSAQASPRRNMHITRVDSPARDKLDTLLAMLSRIGTKGKGVKVIIFLNHRESVERVYAALRKHRLPAGIYHGGLEQLDREKAIALLNNGTTPILVTTDLASRGLDIDNVDAVVHYHLPPSQQAWVHRNGRTARAGAKGEVYIITSDADDIPPYVDYDAEVELDLPQDSSDLKASLARLASPMATLYFNLGKKEKISRGDIVGFLVKIGGLAADEIGHIDLKDHCALVAIPASRLSAVLDAVAHQKIKNKKVKITKIQ